jgi:hypothetical protein
MMTRIILQLYVHKQYYKKNNLRRNRYKKKKKLSEMSIIDYYRHND